MATNCFMQNNNRMSWQKAKLMVAQYEWFWTIFKTLSKIVSSFVYSSHGRPPCSRCVWHQDKFRKDVLWRRRFSIIIICSYWSCNYAMWVKYLMFGKFSTRNLTEKRSKVLSLYFYQLQFAKTYFVKTKQRNVLKTLNCATMDGILVKKGELQLTARLFSPT